MRTTIDLEDDVLFATKELAKKQGTTVGTCALRTCPAVINETVSCGYTGRPAAVPCPVEGRRGHA